MTRKFSVIQNIVHMNNSILEWTTSMTLGLEICCFRQINRKRNAPKIALHIHEYLNKNDGSDQLLNIRLDSFFSQ